MIKNKLGLTKRRVYESVGRKIRVLIHVCFFTVNYLDYAHGFNVRVNNKAVAFGYDVIEVADGNDMQQVLDALRTPACPGKPRYIILNTLKGKGVSFMEGQVGWHGKAPNAEQAAEALKELEG